MQIPSTTMKKLQTLHTFKLNGIGQSQNDKRIIITGEIQLNFRICMIPTNRSDLMEEKLKIHYKCK